MQNIFGIFRTDHSTEVLNKLYLSFSWINQCIKLFINNSKFCHVANWMYYFICLLLWGALSLIRRNALPLCDQRIQSRNWILSQNSMDISLKLENDNGAYRIHLICLHDFIPDFQVVTISRVRIHVHHHVIIVTVECWMFPTQGQMLTSNNKMPKFGSTFQIINYFPDIILKILFLPLQFSVRVFPLPLARRVKIEAERLSPRYWIFRGSSGHFVHLNHIWSVADIEFIGDKSPAPIFLTSGSFQFMLFFRLQSSFRASKLDWII